jgi:hypothetical protein
MTNSSSSGSSGIAQRPQFLSTQSLLFWPSFRWRSMAAWQVDETSSVDTPLPFRLWAATGANTVSSPSFASPTSCPSVAGTTGKMHCGASEPAKSPRHVNDTRVVRGPHGSCDCHYRCTDALRLIRTCCKLASTYLSHLRCAGAAGKSSTQRVWRSVKTASEVAMLPICNRSDLVRSPPGTNRIR